MTTEERACRGPRTLLAQLTLLAQSTLGASSRIRRFVLAPKILDEGGHIAIAGCHAGQPLGVFERGRDIPCVTAEADQREQGFAIAGVARQDVFQNGHGLACPTGRMQPDGIDIGISRPFRLELGGARKLAQRLGRAV